MDEILKQESEKLARSWMQHQAVWLRDYLVAGVEDPRINLQSILSRHFLLRAVCGTRFEGLMEQELRFAAIMNWLLPMVQRGTAADEFEALLFGLRKGVDDVEGISIPAWATRIYINLPAKVEGIGIPNYIEELLSGTIQQGLTAQPLPSTALPASLPEQEVLDTFCRAWSCALGPEAKGAGTSRVSVLEPACGSANDYRFFDAYGLGPLIDYTGFDLCPTNIENARTLFPSVRFERGNVFEISAADASFELCIVHDLFEHLSIEGLATAIKEVCRVTRRGLCAHFFQMDEIAAHVVRPVDEYHWNLLSMSRARELFAKHGFRGQVLHIGTFLRQTTGSDRTHNPNAYTFLLERAEGRQGRGGSSPKQT